MLPDCRTGLIFRRSWSSCKKWRELNLSKLSKAKFCPWDPMQKNSPAINWLCNKGPPLLTDKSYTWLAVHSCIWKKKSSYSGQQSPDERDADGHSHRGMQWKGKRQRTQTEIREILAWSKGKNTVAVFKHWNILPREVTRFPVRKTFKTQLGTSLNNLI